MTTDTTRATGVSTPSPRIGSGPVARVLLTIPPSLPIHEATLVVKGDQTYVRLDVMLTPELARGVAAALGEAATEAEARPLRTAHPGDDDTRH